MTVVEFLRVRVWSKHQMQWNSKGSSEEARGGRGGGWQRGEACGGHPGQHAEGWSNWASHTQKRGEARGGRPGRGGEGAPTTASTTPAAPPTGPR